MSQQPEWEVRGSAPPSSFVDSFPQEVVEFLFRRGFESESAMEKWLNPSLKELRSPFLLKDIEKFTDRLIEARSKSEKICIFADYDMDGTPGLALGLQALKDMGFKDVIYFQPDRFEDGYGLHPYHVEDLHNKGVKVILTVDLGITAVEACEKANELGIDVVITDHHLAQEVLPNAYGIVNPNQPACESGLGHLCGAGVIFYACLALKSELIKQKLLESKIDTKTWLDCFTIGTVTDLVPLIAENRVLVKHGLIALQNTKRVGLQKLMASLGLKGRELSAQDVAIKLAPKLNALSRMGSEVRAIELFLVEDADQANLLVDLILGVNDQRRSIQSENESWALEQVQRFSDKDYIYLRKKDIHPGVLGLIATKVSQKSGKPTFVAAENEENQLLGSARAPENWNGNLVDALTHSADSLEKFGGHASAAGFELTGSSEESFETLLESFDFKSGYASQSLPILYDSELEFTQIDYQFMNWIKALGPFGQEYEVPRFRFNNLVLVSKKVLKGGHLKLSVKQGNKTMEALYFSPENPLNDLQPGDSLSLVAEPQWNFFAGRKSLQLLIVDCRPSATKYEN